MYIVTMNILKTISLILVCLGLSGLNAVKSQSLNCDEFKTGKYFLPDEEGNEYLIHRKKRTQTEQLEGDGTIVKFKVQWIDDCTYELRFKKFVKNPKGHKDYPKDLVVRVEILEVYENSYLQKSVMVGVGGPEEAIMTKVTD